MSMMTPAATRRRISSLRGNFNVTTSGRWFTPQNRRMMRQEQQQCRCFAALDRHHPSTTIYYDSDVGSDNCGRSRLWEQIPSEIESMVQEYSQKQPTSVSLQMLMKTGTSAGGGGGDFWGRTYHSSSNKRGIRWGRIGQQLAHERIVLQMAAYLRHELPIRLAHRIQDLDQCPHMRDTMSVQAVKGIYINSFLELIHFTPHITTLQQEQDFANALSTLYHKHSGVLVQMAQGAYELREEIRRQQKEHKRLYGSGRNHGINVRNNPTTATTFNHNPLRDGRIYHNDSNTVSQASSFQDLAFERMEECHQFLDRFYMSRIGIRFLAGQYLSLRTNAKTSYDSSNSNNRTTLVERTTTTTSPAKAGNSNNNMYHQPHQYIGMICRKTSPSQCVHQAANDASMMCRRTYGRCPKVIVNGRLDLTFPYIPTYLHYVLLELLKNALRATMEQHMNSSVVPPVHVIIADGATNEDVVIKIADEGGGIPRSQMDKIWSYLYTTADPKVQESFIGAASTNLDHSKESPLAGLGYGLPISRSYCRYFGGDLDILSMEGYGTDAFVHLKRLGDSKEPVPV